MATTHTSSQGQTNSSLDLHQGFQPAFQHDWVRKVEGENENLRKEMRQLQHDHGKEKAILQQKISLLELQVDEAQEKVKSTNEQYYIMLKTLDKPKDDTARYNNLAGKYDSEVRALREEHQNRLSQL